MDPQAEYTRQKDDVISSLPAEWSEDLMPAIADALQESATKVVVIDDDPTGTQTVHSVPVLTRWSVNTLRNALESEYAAIYILTNSRSMSLVEASEMNREIGQNLKLASQNTNWSLEIISRSDSTLRGHFPGEVEALVQSLGTRIDGWLLVPFFGEGGRLTVNDIHYVSEGGMLVPVGKTEYAQDCVFGYSNSNLKRWVEEKTNGRIPSNEVSSVSLHELRDGGPRAVASNLMDLCDGRICVVNAVTYRDIEVLVKGLQDAEQNGKKFISRTAASFARVRAGISKRPLVTAEELAVRNGSGGIYIVGSHVHRSTVQLADLCNRTDIARVELEIKKLLGNDRQKEIESVKATVERALKQNNEIVIFTSRQFLRQKNEEDNAVVAQRISDSLMAIIRDISTRPRFILAKGGITSSDIATRGLGVERAWVMGQIVSGVPVWRLGPESRYPDLPYIVFPGNVGGVGALTEIYKKLQVSR